MVLRPGETVTPGSPQATPPLVPGLFKHPTKARVFTAPQYPSVESRAKMAALIAELQRLFTRKVYHKWFFLDLFHVKERCPSTIKGYRTALADALNSQDVSHSEVLTCLLTIFHRDRPKASRVNPKLNLSLTHAYTSSV